VCFGDSATKGAVEEHYPGYIEEWINPEEDDVANEGKSGETTSEGLSRLQALIDAGEYPNAQVYAYWEGGNDLIDTLGELDRFLLWNPARTWYPYREELDSVLATIEENLRQGVQKIKTTDAIPILGTYYYLMAFKKCKHSPIHMLLPFQIRRANHYIDELNQVIYTIAQEEDIPVADIYYELGTMAYWQYHDFNHANGYGNQLIAEVWLQAAEPYLEY
jgi:lysophospholipase L1-like esterase